MVSNYFTFGCGQVFAGHYVKINAETSNRCREIMFEAFGEKWSMQYDEFSFDSSRFDTKLLVIINEKPDGRVEIRRGLE